MRTTAKLLGGFVTALWAAGCSGPSTESEDLGRATQAANICDETVPTNRFVDGIPAYAQCSTTTGAIYSNNGVDTATASGGSDWVRTQMSGGYQCTELAHRYFYFRWNVTWIPNGNAGTWCNTTPPATSGVVQTTTPVHGDLIVFPPGTCGADATTGHVAVVDVVNATTVTIVEENSAGRRNAAQTCAKCYLHVVANSGAGGSGGATSTGGAAASGGSNSMGGGASMGGTGVTGGARTTGGAASTGGRASGGTQAGATGGLAATGGMGVTGGQAPATGGNATGGAPRATGGSVSATGGVASTGGTSARGGASATTGGEPRTTGGATVAEQTGGSTSSDSSQPGEPDAGTSSTGGPSTTEDEGSCGCRTVGRSEGSRAWVLLGLAALVSRRRIRRKRPSPLD